MSTTNNSMDRLRQKEELFFKLGVLFGPLIRLSEHPGGYNEQEQAETLAQYFAEYENLIGEFRTFTQGQPGHNYIIEYLRFYNALFSVQGELMNGRPLVGILTDKLETAKAAIHAIPIPRGSNISIAGTPFSTYATIKDLLNADAANEVAWIDPYMDMSIFHRYLRGIQPGVFVTLVTSEPETNAGKRNKDRWEEFLDISRLYAKEQGPDKYRLIVHQSLLHDRWLILDQKRLFSLGGSVKDAADKSYFTIAHLLATPENLKAVQDHIDNGTEYFGPNTTTHL